MYIRLKAETLKWLQKVDGLNKIEICAGEFSQYWLKVVCACEFYNDVVFCIFVIKG